MQITPEEIESVEEIGTLDGNKVRLLKTRGGWFCATGRKKGSLQDEALAAGSHGAIVKFNLEKQNPGYQPTLMKSESLLNPTIVMDHSHLLDLDLIKSGHDIYSIQTYEKIRLRVEAAQVAAALQNYSDAQEFADDLTRLCVKCNCNCD